MVSTTGGQKRPSLPLPLYPPQHPPQLRTQPSQTTTPSRPYSSPPPPQCDIPPPSVISPLPPSPSTSHPPQQQQQQQPQSPQSLSQPTIIDRPSPINADDAKLQLTPPTPSSELYLWEMTRLHAEKEREQIFNDAVKQLWVLTVVCPFILSWTKFLFSFAIISYIKIIATFYDSSLSVSCCINFLYSFFFFQALLICVCVGGEKIDSWKRWWLIDDLGWSPDSDTSNVSLLFFPLYLFLPPSPLHAALLPYQIFVIPHYQWQ